MQPAATPSFREKRDWIKLESRQTVGYFKSDTKFENMLQMEISHDTSLVIIVVVVASMLLVHWFNDSTSENIRMRAAHL